MVGAVVVGYFLTFRKSTDKTFNLKESMKYVDLVNRKLMIVVNVSTHDIPLAQGMQAVCPF